MDESGWCLTESDPQVFTQLLKDLGVQGLQVDDLYSLDASTLSTLQPIHALIFLFKHVGYGDATTEAGVEVDPQETGVWFANQVINNSCGTLAALNAVMNIPPRASDHPGESIALGDELQNLKDFGSALTSLDLGHALVSSDKIRETHNSFSKSRAFAEDAVPDRPRKKADAYHFVTYLPVNGLLYELDGLRDGPRMHAPVPDAHGAQEGAEGGGGGEGGEVWTDVAREVIEKRIAAYPDGSLMFNLLAVRSDPIPRLTRQLADTSLPPQQQYTLSDQLEHEQHKAQQGHLENTLRRSNLLPVVFELFKAMGQKGNIDKAIEEAKVKGQERRARQKPEDDE